ncbi:uncharacterized protein LOC129754225 [Uranotaenia lowii]|uniref:uncharacterized protein LOC129754225 n=1 Tax=Uranotaenia lowii TaxID=190385 RepID=UPI00247AEFDC|nr:uncharacterized protein LOC129754225 [Uranotaenia lowii]
MSKSKFPIYFFTNGQPFKPPYRVLIDRQKLEENQIVERINRLHYYNGYVVYTLFGELLRSINEIHEDAAFVAVPRNECFQGGPYVKVFKEYISQKFPAYQEPKKPKTKKAITKPLATSYGCKASGPKHRFNHGCRHVHVATRCQDFGAKTAARGKQDVCECAKYDPHGECTPLPVGPKRFVNKKKKTGGGGLSSCCRKQEETKEPVYRLRKRDIEYMEKQRAKRERRTRSRESQKRDSCSCRKKPSKNDQYRKERDKMIKQRQKRMKQEEQKALQEQKAAQNKIKARRRRKACMAMCCPCCITKPGPIWRQPTPHNCVEHLKIARDQAIKRRRALQLQEQTSWESITFPPKFKKKIRGTQVTKEDLKEAKKAAGGGFSCFGKKKKPEPVEETV